MVQVLELNYYVKFFVMSKINTGKIKTFFLVIVILCAMIGYTAFAACVIAGLTVVVPMVALPVLIPLFQDCSVFCQVVVFLFGFGLYSVIICLTFPFLCWGGSRLSHWLVTLL